MTEKQLIVELDRKIGDFVIWVQSVLNASEMPVANTHLANIDQTFSALEDLIMKAKP